MFEIHSQLLRIALFTVAGIGICFFLLPMLVHIVNFGNFIGLFASLVLLIFTVFNQPISKLLKRLWEHRAGKIALSITGGLITAGILLCLVLSCAMLVAIHQKPKSTPTAMIVLGCKVRGTEPSLMLRRRLETALTALEAYPEMICIVSGGKGTDEVIAEAECMRDWLIANGIDENRIRVEDQSTSTSENLRFSQEILEEEGIRGELLIVTDGYHQMRAQYLAQREGLPDCYAAAAPTSWYLVPTYWVREWFGLVHAFVFGS